MTASFYLFDVDHGQCAALRLPNGRWCLFDAGRSRWFSPIQWIAFRAATEPSPLMSILCALVQPPSRRPFRFYKATISHLHADHLQDYGSLLAYAPEFVRVVQPDFEHIVDALESSAPQSWPIVQASLAAFEYRYGPGTSPDFGQVSIRELCLPVSLARRLGGGANSRVNNASIVTRIDVYGTSILLSGDMEGSAWDAVLSAPVIGPAWRSLVGNVDILVAPHHGHSSGYSARLLAMARPKVVLVSVASRDPHVDSRYSGEGVEGLIIGGVHRRALTTRNEGHIRVTINDPLFALMAGFPSTQLWSFGDAALR